jgi:hypothetical protein
MPFAETKRWHSFDHNGRRFRILIRTRDNFGTLVYAVGKIDEVVSDEEVRLFAIPADVSSVTESEAVAAAKRLVVERVGRLRLPNKSASSS